MSQQRSNTLYVDTPRLRDGSVTLPGPATTYSLIETGDEALRQLLADHGADRRGMRRRSKINEQLDGLHVSNTAQSYQKNTCKALGLRSVSQYLEEASEIPSPRTATRPPEVSFAELLAKHCGDDEQENEHIVRNSNILRRLSDDRGRPTSFTTIPHDQAAALPDAKERRFTRAHKAAQGRQVADNDWQIDDTEDCFNLNSLMDEAKVISCPQNGDLLNERRDRHDSLQPSTRPSQKQSSKASLGHRREAPLTTPASMCGAQIELRSFLKAQAELLVDSNKKLDRTTTELVAVGEATRKVNRVIGQGIQSLAEVQDHLDQILTEVLNTREAIERCQRQGKGLEAMTCVHRDGA